MMFNKEQDYWAGFCANEKALIIQTRSGLRLTITDHLYPPHILPLDTDNETLGAITLQALANSRTFIYGSLDDKDFFDINKREQRYKEQIVYLCKQLGYKTKRALFKNMMYCSIWLRNGQIKISPSRHVKLEAWDGMKDVEDIIVTLNNTPAEIGAGLHLALSRCR